MIVEFNPIFQEIKNWMRLQKPDLNNIEYLRELDLGLKFDHTGSNLELVNLRLPQDEEMVSRVHLDFVSRRATVRIDKPVVDLTDEEIKRGFGCMISLSNNLLGGQGVFDFDIARGLNWQDVTSRVMKAFSSK